MRDRAEKRRKRKEEGGKEREEVLDAVELGVELGVLDGAFDHFNADDLIDVLRHREADRSRAAADVEHRRLHL